MVTSIVVKGRFNIGVNSKDKIYIEEKHVALKDIPFVRYRFNCYGNDDIEYIKNSIKKFKHSIHMVEVTIQDGCIEQLNTMDEVDDFENVVRYVYIPVDNNCVLEGSIGERSKELLEEIADNEIGYDRIMIKDNSDTLQYIVANKLKAEIAEITGDDVDDIGVCSSPLSFDNQACLTALKARELAAEYGVDEDMALPTANHQCMECCGCIRYYVIDEDIPVKEGGNSKKAVEKTKTTGNSSAGKKVSKNKPVQAFKWEL